MFFCSLRTTPPIAHYMLSLYTDADAVVAHISRTNGSAMNWAQNKKSSRRNGKQKGRHTENIRQIPTFILFFGFVDSLDGGMALAPATTVPAWTTRNAHAQLFCVLFRDFAISAAASLLAHLSPIDVFWKPLWITLLCVRTLCSCRSRGRGSVVFLNFCFFVNFHLVFSSIFGKWFLFGQRADENWRRWRDGSGRNGPMDTVMWLVQLVFYFAFRAWFHWNWVVWRHASCLNS